MTDYKSTEYRDPADRGPVGARTTPNRGRWLWAAAAAVIVLILVMWFAGGSDVGETVEVAPATEAPAVEGAAEPQAVPLENQAEPVPAAPAQ